MIKKILAVGLIHIVPRILDEAVKATPKIADSVYEFGTELLFGKDKSVKRKQDNTRLSPAAKEEIRDQYLCMKDCRSLIDGTPCNTQQQLTDLLNAKYGLKKSRATYARIWNS
jgi:hypothetical protein